jgi:Domain of unknown function (DUF4388)
MDKSQPQAASQSQVSPRPASSRGGPFVPSHNFITLQYSENLFAQLDKLVEADKLLDALLIDLILTGFSLPMDSLGKFMVYAMKLLSDRGVLLLIKSDGAFSLAKNDPSAGFNLNIYDSPLGFAARYPIVADFACTTIAGLEPRHIESLNSGFAQYILGTSMPVLTEVGKKQKQGFSLGISLNRVVQLIDNYTSVESIMRQLADKHTLSTSESLRLLQELEATGVIFPLFARADFLAKCFQNKKPFRLGRYLIESGMITEAQLQLLLERQQEESSADNEPTLLGLLAVQAGFITMRQLQVLLLDQYLYGGYNRQSDAQQASGSKDGQSSVKDAMIGSLGAIDTHGLLQSLATANKTGLLTIEDREKILQLQMLDGKPTRGRLDQLRGLDALIEFVTTWTEGVFVFRDRETLKDLDSTFQIKHKLSRILLDAALYQDHIVYVDNYLPQGRKTILERRRNFDQSWDTAGREALKFIDESPVSSEEHHSIKSLAKLIDGFNSVDDIVQKFSPWPTHKVLKALYLLLEQDLIFVQKASLFGPLTAFQRISQGIEEVVGREANKAMLQASLHMVHGESAATNNFQIDQQAHISINLNHMRVSQQPVSEVLVELRQWMEAYLAYCRQKLDPQRVDKLVADTVRRTD